MTRTAKSVLVVDDDKMVLALCKLAFSKHGYRVLPAEGADTALRYLETVPVDVVLLDILMPEKDGLEALLEIGERFPNIAVVSMCETSLRSKYDFLRVAKKFGASDVIQKPFRPADVIQIIDALPSNRLTKTDYSETGAFSIGTWSKAQNPTSSSVAVGECPDLVSNDHVAGTAISPTSGPLTTFGRRLSG